MINLITTVIFVLSLRVRVEGIVPDKFLSDIIDLVSDLNHCEIYLLKANKIRIHDKPVIHIGTDSKTDNLLKSQISAFDCGIVFSDGKFVEENVVEHLSNAFSRIYFIGTSTSFLKHITTKKNNMYLIYKQLSSASMKITMTCPNDDHKKGKISDSE